MIKRYGRGYRYCVVSSWNSWIGLRQTTVFSKIGFLDQVIVSGDGLLHVFEQVRRSVHLDENRLYRRYSGSGGI